MIYITGDTHGYEFKRMNHRFFPEQKAMTKEDYVIICGDFGCIWAVDSESKSEHNWLKWLEEKNFTTLFLDGNHENYDRLDAFPVEEWMGGKVQKIRPSILHLMRGQVFHLNGLSFFTFGGAGCHDAPLGIWEPDDPRLKVSGRKRIKTGFRVNHVNWWARELPSEEEMEEGRSSLEREAWKVDYILTHCAPTHIQNQIDSEKYQPDLLTGYLEEIQKKCSCRHWYCGHYHRYYEYDEQFTVLYEQMIRVQ